jgi:hypothetical protein
MDKIIINVARSMPSVVTFKQNRPIILYFNTEILFYIIFRQGKWFYFLHITTFGQNMITENVMKSRHVQRACTYNAITN